MKKLRTALLSIFIIAIVAAGVFFGVQYTTKTGLFKVPGVISYDDSLTTEEKKFIEDAIKTDQEYELDKNLSFSAKTSLEPLDDGGYLYDVYVPVTDFYNNNQSISVEELELAAKELPIFETWNKEEKEEGEEAKTSDRWFSVISILELDNTKHLLRVGENYYLETFGAGAIYRYIYISAENEEKDGEFIAGLVKEKLREFPSKDTVLTLAQTGVTALGRSMIRYINTSHNSAKHFSEKIADYLSSRDLTHTSNEVSFYDNCKFISGTVMSFCAPPYMIEALEDIGLDIVELTGNHNNDYGADANRSTIGLYKDKNWSIMGGGLNSSEAATPLKISQKGSNITMLGYSYSWSVVSAGANSGEVASDSRPGANRYTEEKAKSDIEAAKERGDIVIVDIQYSECYSYPDRGQEMPSCDKPIGGQRDFFRHLVDLGADVVVGTQAHQPQTFEAYNDGLIFYGLGNLFFDQTAWPGTTRGIVLSHYFFNNKLMQTRIMPTSYDSTYQVTFMNEGDTVWFLNRLASAR